MNLTTPSKLRTEQIDNCYLCGSKGKPALDGIYDYFFGVEGSFKFFRCSECSLMWLNPRPIKEDIPKCYKNYLTHTQSQDLHTAIKRRMGGLRDFLRETILCGYYGYSKIHNDHKWCFLGRIIGLLPIIRTRATNDLDERFPHASYDPEALLLDVGCGQGGMLLKMMQFGWKVYGVEPDPVAAGIARAQGIDVHIGTLESAELAAGSFNHIVMNHVIEHLDDPALTVMECMRLLKPGGRLVIYTPNSGSLAGIYFKTNFALLDPPRHLFLFSISSLAKILKQSGFNRYKIKTSPYFAHKIYSKNIMIQKSRKMDPADYKPQKGNFLFALIETLLCFVGLPLGEEIVVTATKDNSK